jgi:hypothetical protein
MRGMSFQLSMVNPVLGYIQGRLFVPARAFVKLQEYTSTRSRKGMYSGMYSQGRK